jgi:hypothetical protein
MFDFFRRHEIPVLLNFISRLYSCHAPHPSTPPPLNAAHFRIRS